MSPQKEWTRAELDELLGEFKVVTVPVDISVEGRQKVLGYDEAERMLRSARLISIEQCSCRAKIIGCNGPLDVCICMDGEAEEAIEKRGAHATTLEIAMDALRRSHEAGLVHLSFETKERNIEIICSCCACCCQALSAISRFGYDRGIIGHADVVAVHDLGLCDGCALCVTKCHFRAWSEEEGRVVHRPDRCSGCGVCVSSCPTGAIRLEKRA